MARKYLPPFHADSLAVPAPQAAVKQQRKPQEELKETCENLEDYQEGKSLPLRSMMGLHEAAKASRGKR